MRLHTRVLVVTAAAVALCGGCRRQTRPQASTEAERIIPVAAQPAQSGTLRSAVHASGVVVPADGAEFLVIAPEPARIVEIAKAAGEMVAAGDILVRFEMSTAVQELARQRADVARAQAQLENVRVAQARVSELVSRGLVARSALTSADRDVTEAQTALTTAEAAQRTAEDAAARATVRAPFAGIVATRLHNPGDLAQASPTDPVLRLVDPQRLEIMASIARGDVPRVLPGATARVAGFIDGREVPLSVRSRPDPATADAEGRLRVRLAFRERSPLPVDAPADVDIDAEERPGVVFVPAEALVREGGTTAVFVAAGSTAERRGVTTGIQDGARVEITSGLKAGDLVIIRGQTGLSDGTAITAEIARP